jgi:hypothetical protein
MLTPDALDDVARRIFDIELVRRPADRASVSEEMVLQAFPRLGVRAIAAAALTFLLACGHAGH